MGRPWLARVVLTGALLAAAPQALAQDPADEGRDGFMAETGFDFWGSEDALRATGSVRWYPNVGDAWLVQFGARVGGERLQFGDADVTAVALGGFVGFSHAVGRIWPTVTLGVDLPFRDGDTVDLETTGTVGGRWFLSGRGSASYAIHFGGFRTEWAGAAGQPDRTGYGLFAGVHQSRLSPAAWRRLGPEGLRDAGGLVGREVELLGGGSPGDFWGGVALDSFSLEGGGWGTDTGIGLQRLCLDDPTNDLTACGWAGELRVEWNFASRDGNLGEFAEPWVPYLGVSAGAVAGPAHTYYDYEGSLWAGLRWQPSSWPFSLHVAAIGRHLVAADLFEDRTVAGVQVGVSFR